MKTAILVAITLAAINLFAQDISAPRAIPPGINQQPNPAPAIDPATGLPFKEKTFDLDFPGATVTDFVPIVQKAAGMSLNIIIPDEYRNVMIPTLKLRNVTVPQLFVAISQASMKRDIHITGYNYGPNGQKQPQWQNVQKTYGFRTVDSPARSNSIWYFYVDEPKYPEAGDDQNPTAQCRFWQLGPYLESFKVEDITTAIETGWKMSDIKPLPKISFHKDTKLLIVVGEQPQLSMVDDVLRELVSVVNDKQTLTTQKPPSDPKSLPKADASGKPAK